MQDFWKLRSDMSEPGGYFRIADNFTSNEREVGQLMTLLRTRGVQGGVYLGVGPEQNFSYIAAIRPAMAFIVDIRRQAAMQHLLFKAIFELSTDRADFVSLLFSKPRPADLGASTAIQDIWNAYARVATDSAMAATHAARITSHLTVVHAFPLAEDERQEVKWVLDAFVGLGPAISTRGSGGGGGGGSGGTFAELTGWAFDATGQPQSFLSTEENFRHVKALHEKNLIVPITGDFGGSKALRAIGAYVTAQGARISAFYVSNVEQYLVPRREEQGVLRQRRRAAARRHERVHSSLLDAPRRGCDRVALSDARIHPRRRCRSDRQQLRRAGLRAVRATRLGPSPDMRSNRMLLR